MNWLGERASLLFCRSHRPSAEGAAPGCSGWVHMEAECFNRQTDLEEWADINEESRFRANRPRCLLYLRVLCYDSWLLFMNNNQCLCLSVSVSLTITVFQGIWKPEYTLVCHPLEYPPLPWRQDPWLIQSLPTELYWLAAEPRNLPVSSPQHWNYKCTLTHTAFIYLLLILVCMGILPSCLFAYHVCAVPTETRWGSEILWTWNYRCLEAAIWVLEIEFRFSRRAIDAVALKPVFLNENFHFSSIFSVGFVCF